MFNSGVGFYETDTGQLSNNGLIVANNLGQFSPIQCISSSKTPNEGSWISPSGFPIYNDDIFDIIVGDENDPGFVQLALKSGRSISFSQQGIYTCTIPDDSGEVVSIHFGLYLPSFASKHSFD